MSDPRHTAHDAPGVSARRRSAKRRRWLGVTLSITTHLLILLVVLSAPAPPQRAPDPAPITVELVDARQVFAAPTPPAKSPGPPKRPPAKRPAPARRRVLVKQVIPKPVARSVVRTRVAPARPNPPRHIAKLAPPHSDAAEGDDDPAAGVNAEMNDAQLVGAETAGSGDANGEGGGGGGGACNMTRRLQDVLRRDPLVRPAVAEFAGKAIRVWDGDWVWMRGDLGRGLTAVRQAIIFEIAFAPAPCRAKPMHGLVVLSLNTGQGPVRLAMGQGEWRWSDLLTPRSGFARR